jgi:rod shape-determining protein MreD
MRTSTRLGPMVALLVIVAVTLQTVFIARLNLPGVGPDLLIITVAAVGLATSRNYGAITGFAAGLLVDIMPPDQTTLGVTAILLALVGYFAGSISEPRAMVPAQLMALLIALTGFMGVANILMAAFVEGRLFDVAQAAWLILAVVAYTAVLGILVVPPLQRRLLWSQEGITRRPSSSEPLPVNSGIEAWRR